MSLLMTLLLAVSAAAQTPAATPAKAGTIDGKKIFALKCATCHRKDGKGNPVMAKMFKVDPANLDLTTAAVQKMSDADLTKLIASGKGKMPAFAGKLKDAEIAAVATYVRSLPTPAPKAAK